jgi:hypothetical protein
MLKVAAYLGGEAEAELAVDGLPETLDGVSLLVWFSVWGEKDQLLAEGLDLGDQWEFQVSWVFHETKTLPSGFRLVRRIQGVKPNIKSSQVKLLKRRRPLHRRFGYSFGVIHEVIPGDHHRASAVESLVILDLAGIR